MASRLLLSVFASALFAVLLYCSAVSATDNEAIKINGAWIADAPPAVSVHAAYAHIENLSEHDQVLIGVTSPQFARVEIHTTINQDGVIGMRPETQLRIPAHSSIDLAPGARHMMLFDAVAPLRLHDTVVLSFLFANGVHRVVTAKITKRQKR